MQSTSLPIRPSNASLERYIFTLLGSLPFKKDHFGAVGQQVCSLETLEEVEWDHIQAILQHTGGRVSGLNGAALLFGMKATTLEARMKKLGLQHMIVRV